MLLPILIEEAEKMDRYCQLALVASDEAVKMLESLQIM
jgi:hypothetical protein